MHQENDCNATSQDGECRWGFLGTDRLAPSSQPFRNAASPNNCTLSLFRSFHRWHFTDHLWRHYGFLDRYGFFKFLVLKECLQSSKQKTGITKTSQNRSPESFWRFSRLRKPVNLYTEQIVVLKLPLIEEWPIEASHIFSLTQKYMKFLSALFVLFFSKTDLWKIIGNFMHRWYMQSSLVV